MKKLMGKKRLAVCWVGPTPSQVHCQYHDVSSVYLSDYFRYQLRKLLSGIKSLLLSNESVGQHSNFYSTSFHLSFPLQSTAMKLGIKLIEIIRMLRSTYFHPPILSIIICYHSIHHHLVAVSCCSLGSCLNCSFEYVVRDDSSSNDQATSGSVPFIQWLKEPKIIPDIQSIWNMNEKSNNITINRK